MGMYSAGPVLERGGGGGNAGHRVGGDFEIKVPSH